MRSITEWLDLLQIFAVSRMWWKPKRSWRARISVLWQTGKPTLVSGRVVKVAEVRYSIARSPWRSSRPNHILCLMLHNRAELPSHNIILKSIPFCICIVRVIGGDRRSKMYTWTWAQSLRYCGLSQSKIDQSIIVKLVRPSRLLEVIVGQRTQLLFKRRDINPFFDINKSLSD